MFVANHMADHDAPLSSAETTLLGPRGVTEALESLAFRGGATPTPLVSLPGLAARLGVGELVVKDEGHRLGLGSFKALGGAYAVTQLAREAAARRLRRPVGLADFDHPDVRGLSTQMTFACATDGNHGRSVAQGAQSLGARSVIFMHEGVSQARADAIAGFGARIVRVAGTYDDSVREASRVSAEQGWTVVSDTSWPGYEHVPGLVMQGYTALVREVLDALAEPPTHVFVQAGVGGLAAAVAGHLAVVLGDRRPRVVVVEPSRAACLLESAQAGRPVAVRPSGPTVMAMLECYEPSLAAWSILAKLADAFMTVEDDDAVEAMRLLARPSDGDPAIVAGESGGAGLAGLIRAAGDPDIGLALGLDAAARVLVINTEGATDPALYRALVGMDPAEVTGDPVHTG
jgi:diaminopropionate ammonia-lyase